jgi:hypothetical protein
MMFLILLVEELEGCLEWTLKFQEEAEQTLGGLIISQSGVKKIAVTAAVTWYRGIRNFNSLILMLLIILTGTTETDLEDGQERLLKLLYLKVSLIMDQVLLQQ